MRCRTRRVGASRGHADPSRSAFWLWLCHGLTFTDVAFVRFAGGGAIISDWLTGVLMIVGTVFTIISVVRLASPPTAAAPARPPLTASPSDVVCGLLALSSPPSRAPRHGVSAAPVYG